MAEYSSAYLCLPGRQMTRQNMSERNGAEPSIDMTGGALRLGRHDPAGSVQALVLLSVSGEAGIPVTRALFCLFCLNMAPDLTSPCCCLYAAPILLTTCYNTWTMVVY